MTHQLWKSELCVPCHSLQCVVRPVVIFFCKHEPILWYLRYNSVVTVCTYGLSWRSVLLYLANSDTFAAILKEK